jgi:hypothetical protein
MIEFEKVEELRIFFGVVLIMINNRGPCKRKKLRREGQHVMTIQV